MKKAVPFSSFELVSTGVVQVFVKFQFTVVARQIDFSHSARWFCRRQIPFQRDNEISLSGRLGNDKMTDLASSLDSETNLNAGSLLGEVLDLVDENFRTTLDDTQRLSERFRSCGDDLLRDTGSANFRRPRFDFDQYRRSVGRLK